MYLSKRLEVFDYEDECAEDEEEDDMSTHFLRIQKNQLIDLKQHLERYVNTSPLFGLKSGRYEFLTWAFECLKQHRYFLT